MSRNSFRLFYIAAITSLTSLFFYSAGHGAENLRTVMLTGDPIPGQPSGVVFDTIPNAPTLNAEGVTSFISTLLDSGSGSPGKRGIWSESSGSLELIALAGEPAPGSTLKFFSYWPSPLFNAADQTSFHATLQGFNASPANGHGIWTHGPGPLSLVAWASQQVPGAPSGVNYFQFENLMQNEAGQKAFFTELAGEGVDTTNDEAIISEATGSLDLLAREGDAAPGTSSGVVFSNLDSNFTMNGMGRLAFASRLTGSGVNSTGLWSDRSGDLDLVVRGGDTAPGVPSGLNFFGFSSPRLNSASHLAFKAFLQGSGVNAFNDSGLWSDSSGLLQLVAREGDQAPGTAAGQNFRDFEDVVLNTAGQTAFIGSLIGLDVDSQNNSGIWIEEAGNLRLVAREGDHAPGTPSGTSFKSFAFVLNAAGQTAFIAGIGPDSNTLPSSAGIWAEDIQGELHLIARHGDQLEVVPGDIRTISGFGFSSDSGNDDSRLSGFNDRGQLAFVAFFNDGSQGIFVSDLVIVPEPSTLLLVFGAIVVMQISRQRLYFF